MLPVLVHHAESGRHALTELRTVAARTLEHIRPADCLGSGAAAALSAVGVPFSVSKSLVTSLTHLSLSSSSAFSLARLSPSSFVLRASREGRRRLCHVVQIRLVVHTLRNVA